MNPRVQLALNVTDLESAVDFYRRLFDAEPAKLRPGYANFALDSPPLKLVLIENGERDQTVNHLGVEVGSTAEVAAAHARVRDRGLQIEQVEEQVACCHALQDKFWTRDPDGAPWEFYTVLADAPEAGMNCSDASPCC